MENMEVILYPKEIHISTQSSFSLRFTYKKMSITTNHELQKFENRECYPIRNSVAMIKDEVRFNLSRQFELKNTKVEICLNKIVIVVIGIKGRQVCCLGDICLDLSALRERKMKEKELFRARVDKCKDSKAFLLFDINFIEKPIDLNELKKSRKEPIPQLGMLKTDYYYKEELYISRRQKEDKPTAYQISRKNYKKTEITRNDNSNTLSKDKDKNNINTLSKQKQKKTLTTLSKEKTNQTNLNREKNYNTTLSKDKRDSKDSLKQNNQGSYKKRFLYDVHRPDKSRQKSHTKQIGSNYLSVYQKEYKKDKSPSPRMKTPQPITLDTLKSKQTHNRTQTKVQPLNFSGINRNNVSSSDQNHNIDPDTFRAHPQVNTTLQHLTNPISHHFQQQELSQSNISGNSLSSISNQKESKYRTITQKLQMIESKIRKQKEKYGDSQEDQIERDGNSKLSHSQIEELESYQIGNSQLQQKPPSPITQKSYLNKKAQISSQKNTQILSQKQQSPINQAEQTPAGVRKHQEDIKMSEFTINSRKHQITGLEQQQSPQNQSPMRQLAKQPQSTNKTFENITEPSMNRQQTWRQGVSIKQQLNQSRREMSPPFDRRDVELKLQKKGSMGRNYLETQVKMMELQIQEKDMKFERLQKKHLRKEKECGKLWEQNEEYEKKLTTLSAQLIETKSRLLQLQRENQQFDTLKQKVTQKERQLRQKQLEVNNLTNEIQKLNINKDETIVKYSNSKPQTNNEEVQTQNVEEEEDKFSKVVQEKEQRIKYQQFQISKQNQLIESLNSQLQTYQNEISSLRQRNQQLYLLKSKNQELVNIKENHLQLISTLQNQLQSLQQKEEKSITSQAISSLQQSKIKSPLSQNDKQSSLQSQKLPSYKLIPLDSPQNTERQSPQASRSAQQLLQQTIEKQSLLQQSLKSLEIQNKTLTQNLKTLTENLNLTETQKRTLQEKISSVEKDKKQLQLSFNQLKLNNQTITANAKSMQEDKKKLQSEIKSLIQKLQRKQKTVEKLSAINESLNTKIFNLEDENNNKFQQLNQQIDALVLKNAQNQQLIKELNQKLISKEKEMNILKQLLRDREDEENQAKLQKKKPMRRQLSSESQRSEQKQPYRHSDAIRGSKSDNLIKIKVTEQGKQNFYDNYLNEKAKSTNLQAQLRYAENDIRNLKMKIDLLTHEKKDLEQEIDMIAYNNDRDLAKKGLQHKVSMESNSISETVKLQNKVLKEEIKLLQSQVKELNVLLDSAIQRTANFQVSQISAWMGNPNAEKSIINEKYVALTRRLQAYESELRIKKNKMAEIVNAIWRGGNAGLIDEIDRIMGTEE